MKNILLFVLLSLTGCDYSKFAHEELVLAQSHLDHDRYDLAIKRLVGTVDRNPRLDTAYYLLGAAYEGIDSFRLAHLYYTQALTINSEYIFALIMRGRITGGIAGLSDLNKAVLLDSTLAIAYYERAKIHNNMNNPYAAFDDALTAERHGLSADLLAVIRFHAQMGLLNYNAALTEINVLIASDSLNPHYIFSKYVCYARIGNIDLAEQLYQKALSLGMDKIPHQRIEDMRSVFIPFSAAELKQMEEQTGFKHF